MFKRLRPFIFKGGYLIRYMFLYASKELQSKHRQTAGYSNKMLISITDIISITRTFNMVYLLKLIFRIDRPNASTQ